MIFKTKKREIVKKLELRLVGKIVQKNKILIKIMTVITANYPNKIKF